MTVRRIILFAGAVALIVGVAGLLTPVSVSPAYRTVGCGTAVAADLTEARANDDGSAANVPVDGEVLADIDYTRLCQMELTDRRMWTIPLAVMGVLAIGGSFIGGGGRESNPPATGSAARRF